MTDPFLLPYLTTIESRNGYIKQREKLITDNGKASLYDVSDYHLFFGLHLLSDRNIGWVFREWAPNATAIYIIGTMTDWKIDERFRLFRRDSPSDIVQYQLFESDSDIWERTFEKDSFKHGDLYKLKVFWNGGEGERIPTCATRVIQDAHSLIFTAQVWNPEPESAYRWRFSQLSSCSKPLSLLDSDEPLLIYEAHVGMAQEEEKIGSFKEFEEKILPRIKDAGYNAIQFMAIQEHPYYGSFGYHVSNFFALSSRFGTPDEFKSLVDATHRVGIKVIIDIVHSHAVSNEVEGLSRFDGTLTQFFHDGERGVHRLWGSRCFDYSKPMVVKFLLSNCRYWIEQYRVDGFRFDGITSMLYKDHGIGRAFTSYKDYFEDELRSNSTTNSINNNYNKESHTCLSSCNNIGVDLDALTYLYLANRLIHSIVPSAITIAEDVSGYPGLAAPQDSTIIKNVVNDTYEEKLDLNNISSDFKSASKISEKQLSGIGFDYRFAMGIPDFWIKLLKEYRDEDWQLGQLWYELNARREDEKTISYAECHDQALVGDKTLMMHLMGGEIYSSMSLYYETFATFRGTALHKMIRLITLATAGAGYLNFMGNEFGHPEWIDFPAKHNNWSYHFARRQWSLCDNRELYFSLLAQFDKDMITLAKRYNFICVKKAELLHIHEDNKVVAFQRESRYCKDRGYCNLIFVFNFNPQISFNDYLIDAPAGKYKEIMNSDDIKYGGKGRLVSGQIHFTHFICDEFVGNKNYLSLYLPTRSAIVLLLS